MDLKQHLCTVSNFIFKLCNSHRYKAFIAQSPTKRTQSNAQLKPRSEIQIAKPNPLHIMSNRTDFISIPRLFSFRHISRLFPPSLCSALIFPFRRTRRPSFRYGTLGDLPSCGPDVHALLSKRGNVEEGIPNRRSNRFTFYS